MRVTYNDSATRRLFHNFKNVNNYITIVTLTNQVKIRDRCFSMEVKSNHLIFLNEFRHFNKNQQFGLKINLRVRHIVNLYFSTFQKNTETTSKHLRRWAFLKETAQF